MIFMFLIWLDKWIWLDKISKHCLVCLLHHLIFLLIDHVSISEKPLLGKEVTRGGLCQRQVTPSKLSGNCFKYLPPSCLPPLFMLFVHIKTWINNLNLFQRNWCINDGDFNCQYWNHHLHLLLVECLGWYPYPRNTEPLLGGNTTKGLSLFDSMQTTDDPPSSGSSSLPLSISFAHPV